MCALPPTLTYTTPRAAILPNPLHHPFPHPLQVRVQRTLLPNPHPALSPRPPLQAQQQHGATRDSRYGHVAPPRPTLHAEIQAQDEAKEPQRQIARRAGGGAEGRRCGRGGGSGGSRRYGERRVGGGVGRHRRRHRVAVRSGSSRATNGARRRGRRRCGRRCRRCCWRRRWRRGGGGRGYAAGRPCRGRPPRVGREDENP